MSKDYHRYATREPAEEAIDEFDSVVKDTGDIRWIALAKVLRVIIALLVEIATYSPIPTHVGKDGRSPE